MPQFAILCRFGIQPDHQKFAKQGLRSAEFTGGALQLYYTTTALSFSDDGAECRVRLPSQPFQAYLHIFELGLMATGNDKHSVSVMHQI